MKETISLISKGQDVRALRIFYIIYFAGVLACTIFTMVRLSSKKNALNRQYSLDFLFGLLWPFLFISERGRAFLKELIKG